MKDNCLLRLISKISFRKTTEVQKRTPRASLLRLEALENRELLDAAPVVEALAIERAALCAPILDLDAEPIELDGALWTVTSTADNVNQSGTLRYAIENANDGDTIVFGAGMNNKTIALGSQLKIAKSLTIDGSALDSITINANGNSRAFFLNAADITLNGLTITGATSGGVYINKENVSLANCSITGNTTATYGGGVYVNGNGAQLVNCLIAENSASDGGGVYVAKDAAQIINCTIVNNAGRGVYVDASNASVPHSAHFYNSIVVLNGTSDVYRYGNYGTLEARNTLSSFSSWDSGANNYAFDNSLSLFENMDERDYTLPNDSVAINAGNSAYLLDADGLDLAGADRVALGQVDLGAYEYNGDDWTISIPSIKTVSSSSGKITISWTNIPNATKYYVAYAEGNGAFVTQSVTGGKTSLALSNLTPNALYRLKVRALNPAANASEWSEIVTRLAGDPESASTVVTTLSDVVDAYDGQISFREAIKYAKAGDTISFDQSLNNGVIELTGGQLFITKSNITVDASALDSLTVDANRLSRAMRISGQSCTVIGLTFTGGYEASSNGGGVFMYGAYGKLIDCVVVGNEARYGGGLDVYGVGSSVVNCVVANNVAINGGGAVVYGEDVMFVNCELTNNTYDGVFLKDVDVSCVNCTIAGNDGFGLYLNAEEVQRVVDLYNTIIVDNSDYDVAKGVDGAVDPNNAFGTFNAYNTLSSYAAWNTSVNAVAYTGDASLFTDPDAGDYTLVPRCVAINAGNNEYLPADVTTDLLGAPRSVGGFVDLGAYEFQGAGQIDAPGLYLYAKTASTITVKWTLVNDATGYVFEYKAENDANYTTISLDASKSQRKLSGLVTGERYSIRIKALGDGVSLDSDYAELVVATSQPLPAPEVTLTDAGGDYLSFSWTPVENAVGYKVMYKCPTDPSYTTLTLDNQTTLTLYELEQEVNYSLKICALGDGNNYTNSAYSPLTAYRTINPFQLLAPEFTAIDASKNAILLHWNAVDNAKKFYVAYAPVGTTTFTTKSVAATNTHYQLTGLTANTEYQIKIRVIGEGEYLNSKYSPVSLAATTKAAVAPTALPIPTVTATATSQNSLLVEWDANPRATGYAVIYKEKSEAAYTTVNVKAGQSSLNLNGLIGSATYYVKARAIGDGTFWTNSAYCGTVVVKTPAPPAPQTLDEPTVVSTSATTNSITVNWSTIDNASEYVLTYAPSGSSSFTTVNVAATSYTIEGLLDGTEYVVKVLAKGDGTNYLDSSYSASTIVTTERIPIEIVVTSLADTVDENDGVITLREAINYANNGDTITFDSALNDGTILLAGTQLSVDKSITIDASALDSLTVDANRQSRVFYLDADNITLKGLTITRGYAYYGGGGGGLYVFGEHIAVENCLISGNSANFGGGVYLYGDGASLVESTISNNYAPSYLDSYNAYIGYADHLHEIYSYSGGYGGGIYSRRGAVITSCIISNNEVNGYGGGFAGSATIENCSIISNMAHPYVSYGEDDYFGVRDEYEGGFGGGVYGDDITIINSTISGNSADLGSGICYDDSDEINVYNSIIAANARNDVSVDSSSSIINAYNTLSSFASWTNAADATNYLYDPSKPLFTDAANGDYTLAPLSQAINRGNNENVSVETDLNGDPRVVDGQVDLGAYEFQTAAPSKLNAPTITVHPGVYQATVNWDSVPNACGYEIEYTKVSDSNWSESCKVYAQNTDISVTIPNLDGATWYMFRVTALGDENHYVNSDASADHHALVAARLDAPAITVVPGVYEATVNWIADPNASGYTLLYKKVSDSDWSVVSPNPSASDTSVTISNLDGATEYEFSLQAIGDYMNFVVSEYSDVASVIVKGKLAAPTLSITGHTHNSVSLKWNAISNASGYTLQYKKASDSNWTTPSNNISNTATIYAVTGLSSATLYNFRIKSNGDGIYYVDSDWSNTVSQKTKETPSVVVNSTLDVIDAYDGNVTLREALITYRAQGTTVTFTSNMAGKTITLGSQIALSQAATINASALSSAVTVSGANQTRIFSLSNASFTINKVNFTQGKSTTSGGAINLASGTLNVNNCTFTSNSGAGTDPDSNSATATGGGGAIYVGAGATLNATGSTFTSNTSTGGRGGGVHISGGTGNFSACAFRSNTATGGGGVAYSAGATGTIKNSLIVLNTASVRGGGVALFNNTDVTFYSDTIVKNTATQSGSGVYVWNNSSLGTFYNSIIVRNASTTVSGHGQVGFNSSLVSAPNVNGYRTLTVDNVAWKNASSATNYVYDNSDVLFVNENSDWHLANRSQACGKGRNDKSPGSTDLDGNTRIVGSNIDLGCYEHQSNSWALLDEESELFEEFDDSLDLIAASLLD